MLRQNRTLVDLDAIAGNYRLLAQAVPKGTAILPIVKANAYGHGLVEVAQAVLSEGAACLGVALAEEGLTLRQSGITADILVMGAAMPRAAEAAVAADLTQTVFQPHTVAHLEAVASQLHQQAKVHIKIDTGMERLGLHTLQEAQALREALEQAPHVVPTGVFTHFAEADHLAEDGRMTPFTRQQLERFVELKACFGPGLPAHASNSAMTLVSCEASFQMVREGISLYGYPPVPTLLPLRHALRWESEVVYVKQVKAGTTIGYGRSYTAPRDMQVATVAVGYGDGYSRALSNKGQMLVGGRRASVVGRVCMDQCMIDVTDISGVGEGTQVVLLGRQGEDEISAEELAAWAGTISYEVLLSITARVPREYIGGAGVAHPSGF